MSSDLTFLTNEPGKSLLDRFQALLGKNTQFFDCLVGYFFISGFHKLYPSLEQTDKIRILIGLKTDRTVFESLERAKEQHSLFSNNERTNRGDIGTGILDVFDRYNFTVNEAEPLEKEVAVDPEMLGKVFENLLR